MASEHPFKKGRKLRRRAEEAVMKLTSRGCRLGPLELVDENEALAAPETPLVSTRTLKISLQDL